MTEYSFTIDPGSLIADSWIHTLRGTKLGIIQHMTLNGDEDPIVFPTVASWQADVVLSPGTNTFYIQGTDVVDNETETLKVEVVLDEYETEIHEVYSDLSKHALQQGLTRLPGEKNIYLYRRVLDTPYYPSATNYEGLVEAISRDLGLTLYRNAFAIHVNRDTYLEPLSESATLEITAAEILVDADELQIANETHKTDPGFNGFYLNYEPRYESDVELFTRDYSKIGTDRYRVHLYDRKVVFEDDSYNMQWIRVRYNYRTSIPVTGNLAGLKTQLEAIQVGGQNLFTVTLLNDSLPVEGLSHRERLVLTTDDEELKWAQVQIYNLHDKRFRASLLNSFGGGYGTKLEAWAGTIAKRSKFGWGAVILDVDSWDPLYKRRDNAGIPHLWDAYRGHWECANPDDTGRYTYSDYTGHSGHCPEHPDKILRYVGVEAWEWHSGIGYGNDLLVTGIDTQ